MNDITSIGVSLSLSNRGLDSLLGVNDKDDAFESLLAAVTGTEDADKAGSVSRMDALEAIIGSAGPLPAYLSQLVAAKGYNAEQKQALYEITARNMNINYSVEAVQQLAGELKEAGLA